MEKGNKSSIIIIILCVLIILGLIGFICYDKGVFGKKENSRNSNTENKTEILEKEQDYDKDKAKELVDKYYVEYNNVGVNIFIKGINLAAKNAIAIKNIQIGKQNKTSCALLYDNSSYAKKDEGGSYTVTLSPTLEELKGNGGGCDFNVVPYYNYNDLNKVYKNLFGKDSNIPKSDFSYATMAYDYIEEKDIFVELECRCGGATGPHFTTYGVQSAKTKGEKLVVNVGYIYVSSPTTDDTAKLTATIGGEEVTLSTTDVQKEGFEKEFLDKYLDKLDTYEFTFKYEDDHYVFVDMQKK